MLTCRYPGARAGRGLASTPGSLRISSSLTLHPLGLLVRRFGVAVKDALEGGHEVSPAGLRQVTEQGGLCRVDGLSDPF